MRRLALVPVLACLLAATAGDAGAQSPAATHELRAAPSRGAAVAGVRTDAVEVKHEVGAIMQRSTRSRTAPTTLMIVGGAMFLGGLLIGDDVGTAIAVGGLAVGVYGLFLYYQ